MKTTKIFIAAGLILITATSCVSKKKYMMAQEDLKQVEQANNRLNSEINQLEDALAEAQDNADQQLERAQLELADREKELEKREAAMAELEALVNDQRDAVAALHQEVCSALKCFTPEELQVNVRDGKLYVSMSDKLLFKSGSDEVNDRGEEAIQMLAQVLNNAKLEVMVEGHTDSIPISTSKYDDNWDLSVHRATSVARILVNHGIPEEKIISAGRGEHAPIASNETEEGRSLNRRTEIVLSPRLDKLWKLTEYDYAAEVGK